MQKARSLVSGNNVKRSRTKPYPWRGNKLLQAKMRDIVHYCYHSHRQECFGKLLYMQIQYRWKILRVLNFVVFMDHIIYLNCENCYLEI